MMQRAPMALLIMAAFACTADRRSATRSDAEASWSVDSHAELDFAATVTGDSSAFLLAAAGLRLTDGTIVLADLYDASIRYFDASGHLIHRVGRRGSGPGEFQDPSWLGHCAADSVFVWDAALSRMTVLDSNREIARSFQLPGSPVMVRCSEAGVLAAFLGERTVQQLGAAGWSIRYSMPVSILSAAGDTIDTLDNMPIGELRPLGRHTQMAMTNEELYIGTADSAYIDVFTLTGERVRSIDVGIESKAPSQANYEAAIDLMVRPFPGPNNREEIKSNMLEIPMPELMPPYSDILTDDAGVLWVVTSAPGDMMTQLRALSRDGTILGDVSLPIDMDVFDIGRDYVLGAYHDEAGEQHVVLYRLHRNEQS